jgi:hypothetical protein
MTKYSTVEKKVHTDMAVDFPTPKLPKPGLMLPNWNAKEF